jgi:hypothetical protein
MVNACTTHDRNDKYNKTLVGKPAGEKPLGRHKRRWEHNIRTDHSEVEWEGVDWIYLSQDRDQRRALVNSVKNLQVPQKSEENSCSRKTLFHGVS